MTELFAPLLQAMKADAPGSYTEPATRHRRTVPPNGPADEDLNAPRAGGGKCGVFRRHALPTEPLSIVVDKDNHRLAVVTGDVIVRSHAIGLGGAKTPSGSFVINEKVRNPNGRDDSEFGSRGMTLSGTLYAIHGTNVPDSIGKDESYGCVRMNRQDLEQLYDLVPLGTKVTIKSGVLPDSAAPDATRFRLQPAEDETNPAVVCEWLD